MNVYVSENHIVVGQQCLKDKENEIIAISQLLEKLDIEDAIISIDTIGTLVNIAQDILNRKAYYFLAVKENQGALNKQITKLCLFLTSVRPARGHDNAGHFCPCHIISSY